MSKINLYSRVIFQLKAVRRKETVYMLSTGFLKTVFWIVFAFLLAVLLEWAVFGNTEFRTNIIKTIGGIAVVSFLYYMLKPLLRAFGIRNHPTVEDIALRIGKRFTEVGDKLCNAMQIYNSRNRSSSVSAELAVAEFDQTIAIAEEVDFEAIINRKPLRRATTRTLLLLILLIALLATIAPLGSAFDRLLNFNKSYIPPSPFQLQIFPGDTTMLRSSRLVIKIKALGTAPAKIRLFIRQQNQINFDSYELDLDTSNTYIYINQAVKRSFEYYAEADWMSELVHTDTAKVTVINLPNIRSIIGRINYPTYTGLSSKSFTEQNADIAALRGSTIDIAAYSNKELQRAWLIIENIKGDTSGTKKVDTMKLRMSVAGRKATARFFLAETGTYHIKFEDTDLQTNANPMKYSMTALSDDYPSISQTKPVSDVTINQSTLLPIQVSISDDYGFTSLKLYYRLIQSKYTPAEEKFSAINIPISKLDIKTDINYVWDLSAVSISPEDIYEYYFEVADNDNFGGPKKARTNTLTVRLPSLEEVMEESDLTQKDVKDQIEEAVKDAEELKKDMEELNREMLKKNPKEELQWSDKKKAESLMSRQEDIKNKMQNLAQKLQDNTKQLSENNMISQETLEKYQELQNLMKQVDSPELKKLQQDMKKALENMTAEDMKKALEKFKFNEEQFKKNIERSLKMLKRIQAQQKADALAKRADELADRQDKLAEKTKEANADQAEEVAKQQNKLTQDFKELEKDIKSLEDLMKEIGEKEMPMDMLKDAQNELSPKETEQNMQSAEQNIKSQKKSDANKNQKKASQNMRNFANKMQSMRQQMDKDSKEKALKQIQKSISNLLELSKRQESLGNKTKSMDYSSTKFPEYARKQADLFDQLANTAMAMAELGEQSFAVTPDMISKLQNAMQSMQDAYSKLSERSSSEAAQPQQSSMAAMNGAVSSMQDQLAKLQKGGACSNPGDGEGEGEGEGQSSSSGMSQQMQQLAAQQQAINQAMQDMMNKQGGGGKSGQGGGQSMSLEQQAEMKRLGGKQGSAGKSAQDLSEEQKKYANQDRKRLEALDKIADEMQEIATEMKSGKINQETLNRQQKILNRLLDASQSINDRDFEKNREAKSGKNYRAMSPAELDMLSPEGKKQAIQELMKSNKQGYSEDYEKLIKQYYEALQK
ncbi:MAG: DUF4175 family protein [bacterium]